MVVRGQRTKWLQPDKARELVAPETDLAQLDSLVS